MSLHFVRHDPHFLLLLKIASTPSWLLSAVVHCHPQLRRAPKPASEKIPRSEKMCLKLIKQLLVKNGTLEKKEDTIFRVERYHWEAETSTHKSEAVPGTTDRPYFDSGHLPK
ncbi:hypothetical protein K438DRAFT_1748471 [Mycena galopus ATCC 62051]|nr:hypothetical protein K438DRAFT_1748471 [Mycena galopus ATCC 62051]